MTFDKPEHKELCLKIIEASNFPGMLLDLAMDFKQAVLDADIKENESVIKDNRENP